LRKKSEAIERKNVNKIRRQQQNNDDDNDDDDDIAEGKRAKIFGATFFPWILLYFPAEIL
jgi:hypothetical protein